MSFGGPQLQAVTNSVKLFARVRAMTTWRHDNKNGLLILDGLKTGLCDRRSGDIAEDIRQNTAELLLCTESAKGPTRGNSYAYMLRSILECYRRMCPVTIRVRVISAWQQGGAQLKESALSCNRVWSFVIARYANAPAKQKGTDPALNGVLHLL